MTASRVEQITAFGGPEVIKTAKIETRDPGPGELRIRVEAAAVNPVDGKMRSGAVRVDLPFVLGWDVAGVVEKVGPGADSWREGDAVIAMLGPRGGGYADRVLVSADQVGPKPQSLDPVKAAAVPLAGLTAWQGLVDHGRLKPGETVLITGAAGAVGRFAAAFAREVGAKVIGLVHDPADRVEAADRTVASERLAQEDIRADLVFDVVGGEVQKAAYGKLKPDGRLVTTVGLAPGVQDRAESMMVKPDAAELRKIAELVDRGVAAPDVELVLPLDQAAEAHARLERHEVKGKIVLKP
jgi:NADPH:quinone reductase-like Zn-dependent oxidoreductase